MDKCVKSSVNDSRDTIGDDTKGVASCSSYFDGLVCWPSTPAGEQARVECFHIKAFAQAFRQIKENFGVDAGGQSEYGYAYKSCNQLTDWAEKANYSECLSLISDIPHYGNTSSNSAVNKRILASLNLYLSIISLASLLISLAIFSVKSLKCDRLRIHKNFMFSLVLLYLTTILYFEPYIHNNQGADPAWYKSQPWLCHMVLALLMFCFQAPIFWMFIEGIYLHSKVSTNVFNSSAPFYLYYLIGWGLPLLLTVCWVTGMSLTTESREECWDDYSNSALIYIIVIPMILALAVNLLFLVSIMKVVVTKLRVQSNLSTQQLQVRRAVRATLILFPLLGITNLLFFINPKSLQRKEHEYIYMLVNSVLKSSQGIFLSFLYCFCNSDVQDTLKRFFRRFWTRATVNGTLARSKSSTIGGRRRATSVVFLDLPHQGNLLSANLELITLHSCKRDSLRCYTPSEETETVKIFH